MKRIICLLIALVLSFAALANCCVSSFAEYDYIPLEYDTKAPKSYTAKIGRNLSAAPMSETATAYNFTDYTDNISVYGRAARVSDGYKADVSGGGIYFALDCSGRVDVTLKNEWQNGFIGVIIDSDTENAAEIPVAVGDKTITIAEELEKGVHTFKLLKLSAWYTDIVTFKTIIFDGEFAPKPVMKPLKIEYYGDSITCGVGSVPNGDGTFHDSAFGSYALYCSEYLDAEFSLVAAPGYGFLYGYNTGTSQTLDTLYDYSLFNDKAAWDYANYDADIVVLYLGINDVNYSKNKTLITDSQIIYDRVFKYIEHIREKNSDCKIVIMGGSWNLNDWLNGPFLKLSDALKAACEHYNNVYLFTDFSLGSSGGGWHPTREQAAQGIKPVADFIKTTVIPDEFVLGTKNQLTLVPTTTRRKITASKTGVPTGQTPPSEKTVCSHKNKHTETTASTYFKRGVVRVICDDCGALISIKNLPLRKLARPSVKLGIVKKKLKISWNKVSSSNGYTIQVCVRQQGKRRTGKWKTVKTISGGKKLSWKWNSNLKNGKYKVRVAAYVKQGNKKKTSAWSTVKSINIKFR